MPLWKKLVAIWIFACVPVGLWMYAQMFHALFEKWGYWAAICAPVHITIGIGLASLADNQRQP